MLLKYAYYVQLTDSIFYQICTAEKELCLSIKIIPKSQVFFQLLRIERLL